MTQRAQWLYEQDRDIYVPGDLAIGPWAPGTQNGGAVAALLADVLDHTPSHTPMVAMDFHVEIFKPIPLHALVVRCNLLRDGKRLQIVQATASVADAPVAMATLVRLRPSPSLVTERSAQPLRRATPDRLPRLQSEFPVFDLLECRPFGTPFTDPGAGAAWFRLHGQVVAGRSGSPLAAASLAADAGSGLSAIVRNGEWAFPNVSLALHAHRIPRGEWLLLDSEMATDGDGVAQVNSVYSDLEGSFGSAHQAVVLERVGSKLFWREK